ncbi:hypothetical protein E4U61_002047 [Claviceps capensis]|nr:hypothetical protein E4U61_002047 [Claviceps capensis]
MPKGRGFHMQITENTRGRQGRRFWESRGLHSQKRVLSWAWTIRTDYAERKACAKVAGGQLESGVPAIVTTPALALISTSVRFQLRTPH